MGLFDTYIVTGPHCDKLASKQNKPGWMDTFVFSEGTGNLGFLGSYYCDNCKQNFTVELEAKPRLVVKKE